MPITSFLFLFLISERENAHAGFVQIPSACNAFLKVLPEKPRMVSSPAAPAIYSIRINIERNKVLMCG